MFIPAARSMLDSANPRAIMARLDAGEKPDLVAGYPDFGWSEADFDAVTERGIQVVRITQHDPPDWRNCSVLDWEWGAVYDAPSLQSYVGDRNDFRPDTATVYESESNIAQVVRALRGANWWAWVAWWRTPVTMAEVTFLRGLLPKGARLAAIQDMNDPDEDVDRSWVVDPLWHPTT